jgi:hypothetical protein
MAGCIVDSLHLSSAQLAALVPQGMVSEAAEWKRPVEGQALEGGCPEFKSQSLRHQLGGFDKVAYHPSPGSPHLSCRHVRMASPNLRGG